MKKNEIHIGMTLTETELFEILFSLGCSYDFYEMKILQLRKQPADPARGKALREYQQAKKRIDKIGNFLSQAYDLFKEVKTDGQA